MCRVSSFFSAGMSTYAGCVLSVRWVRFQKHIPPFFIYSEVARLVLKPTVFKPVPKETYDKYTKSQEQTGSPNFTLCCYFGRSITPQLNKKRVMQPSAHSLFLTLPPRTRNASGKRAAFLFSVLRGDSVISFFKRLNCYANTK